MQLDELIRTHIAEEANDGVEQHNRNHGRIEYAGTAKELLRLSHRVLHGHDDADALHGKDDSGKEEGNLDS